MIQNKFNPNINLTSIILQLSSITDIQNPIESYNNQHHRQQSFSLPLTPFSQQLNFKVLIIRKYPLLLLISLSLKLLTKLTYLIKKITHFVKPFLLQPL